MRNSNALLKIPEHTILEGQSEILSSRQASQNTMSDKQVENRVLSRERKSTKHDDFFYY